MVDRAGLEPVLNRVVQDLRSLRGCISDEERFLLEPFLGTYNEQVQPKHPLSLIIMARGSSSYRQRR